MNLLCEDVTLWADGGGKIKQAALRPIRGRDAVARFSLGTKRFWPENSRVELEEVNGQVALIIRAGGQVFSVLTIDSALSQLGPQIHSLIVLLVQ
jgi:RNA polymerase sigma-70 factor (ECF subfamily)